jgi:hypothetical protein
MADELLRDKLSRVDGPALVQEIAAALKSTISRATSADLSDLKAEIDDIAYRAVLYSSRKALGEDVEDNLREVRLQAGLVEATILRRESEAAAAAWRGGVNLLLDILAGLIKRLMVS